MKLRKQTSRSPVGKKQNSYPKLVKRRAVAKKPARKPEKKPAKRKMPRWTAEETAVLRLVYKTHSNAEVAEILGRKVSSVVFKGHRLGLSKGIRRLREMGRQNISSRWNPKKSNVRRKSKS